MPLVHNQNEKNWVHYSWDIYEEKALWVGDYRNFNNNFVVKTNHLNLKFFLKYCRVLSLNTKNKIFKKDTIHVKIAWHSKREKKKIEKTERKRKNKEKPNSNNKYYFTFAFSYREIYILSENIFEKA